jgi:3-oxoadipate enol-lactonase
MTDAGGPLGHSMVGDGAVKVVVTNDWLCDTTTWESARAFMDGARFTWAFADLRGYGRSKDRAGAHTLEEAAGDVVALADALGWERFAIVGHSMSSLVALHLAQRSDRITRAVALTPPPPGGFGADAATMDAMRALARSDVATRAGFVRSRPGPPLSEGWARFKAERWHACADPEAAAAYVPMFAGRGLPDLATRIACPVLAVTGELDIEPMRSAAVTKLLAPLCGDLEVTPLPSCGHYPMQEAPPLLVGIVERFLLTDAAARAPRVT